MARGPKIVVIPERTRVEIAATQMRRAASPLGRLGMALGSRRRRKERERKVERHWDILEGRSSSKRGLSKIAAALMVGVSGIGGLAFAEKMDGFEFHPMGRRVPASAVAIVAAGVGAYALRKRHKDIAHAVGAAGVGVLIGLVHKENARRSGGKT